MRIPRSSTQGLDRDYGAMTPMIDVVFNLLIFFVVSAGSFTVDRLLTTDLSSTEGTVATLQPPEDSPWATTVELQLRPDDEGRTIVEMNGTPYADREQLKTQLRTLAELGPESPVILDTAADVPLGDLIDIYDACRASGFQSINFAAGAPAAASPR
ncbi:MAG: biopolymer transporter ExbD [Planctomyces sp.]|nr:biopolymer transporter ExbD [Planctomyces sp.]